MHDTRKTRNPQQAARILYPREGGQCLLRGVRSEAGTPVKTWRTKQEVAQHFQIGVRTVSKLMRRRILPYSKLKNLVRLDLMECERALEFFKVECLVPSGEPVNTSANPRRWLTKRQVADHFRLSTRSITTMMRRRSLPWIKIGQVVRFDLDECDRVFESVRVRSILERQLKAPPARFSEAPRQSALASLEAVLAPPAES